MQKACEHQQPLYICFVDFKKAFYSISHDNLCVNMMDMGYPLHLTDLLVKLHGKQLAEVKVAGTLSEGVKKESDKVVSYCPFSVLVQHPGRDGDEGDPRWILNKAGVKKELLEHKSKEASTLWSHHKKTREKEIMQGTMSGARRRGRSRTAWMDNIKTWTRCHLKKTIPLAFPVSSTHNLVQQGTI